MLKPLQRAGIKSVAVDGSALEVRAVQKQRGAVASERAAKGVISSVIHHKVHAAIRDPCQRGLDAGNVSGVGIDGER